MKPVPHGEPYAGKLHVRFDEGAGVPDNKGRSALLYTLLFPSFEAPLHSSWLFYVGDDAETVAKLARDALTAIKRQY